MTRRALWLLALAACGAGCLSAPPSGVITCKNSCPISGYYCAGDGYCWANGEYPNLSSTGGSTSAGIETTGTGGTGSSGSSGSTGTAGQAGEGSASGGAKTGGSSTGKAGTGGSSTGGAKASTGTTGV